MGADDIVLRQCDGHGKPRPRLVFADWLQEQGRGSRAEFIRAQCEHAKWVAEWGGPDVSRDVKAITPDQWRIFRAMRDTGKRARDLLFQLTAADLLATLPGHVAVRVATDTITEHWQADPPRGSRPYFVEWSRGFVSRFEGTADDWLRYAHQLTASQPITDVTLTTWPPGDDVQTGLKMLWPGIKFTLPDPEPPVSMDAFNAITGNILSQLWQDAYAG